MTFDVAARFVAQVNANSVEAAINEARLRFCHADFGEADCISGEAIIVEDEHEELVWKR